MSVYIQPGILVRIEPFEGPNAPRPLPLESGFSQGCTYEILGAHAPSETSEAYLILENDRSELWFISNRHCRVAGRKGRTHSKNGYSAASLTLR